MQPFIQRLCFFCALPFCLCARERPLDSDLPWITGPLITPSSLVVPAGHVNVEPYLFAVANTGIYQEDWSSVRNDHIFWANSLQVFLQVGVTSWLDAQITPVVFYNATDGTSDWAVGDLIAGFDFQLYEAAPDAWMPNIKFSLRESFPIGKYRQLNPAKKGTDAGGVGSYISSAGLVFGKLIDCGEHYLNIRFGGQYSLPTSVHLSGYNVYGGNADTDGLFSPAQNVQIALGLEFTLTDNWVLAIDGLFNWSIGSDFSGDSFTDAQLELAPVGADPLIQYSLAPAIEYNWDAHLGLILGSWFTIAGKNAVQFCSGVAAFNVYY